MKERYVGRTGLKVSRLGLGTLTWGTDVDEDEASAQLMTFAEAGGTLLDTGSGYGRGASEEMVGALLRDVVGRDDLVIATKAGITTSRGQWREDTSRGAMLRTLDSSLRRLGLDYVDLWQVNAASGLALLKVATAAAGSVSVTVTGPAASPSPTFATVRV